MKRDMDLVREILLGLEKTSLQPGEFLVFGADDASMIDGYDADECIYNLRLAIGAGLVQSSNDHGVAVVVNGLTWEGHDFLDQIRDPEIWRITKEGAKKAGGFSFDLLAALAKGFLKKKIEEHTGVQLDL
ncbi:MAG TPA: DUF2513 domain-containing protein [Rhizomicrobium sp.]|jgi:hypothetical protein|nr:DUF2513 domain-containing protein [Rhizomicrobium sp.]